MLFDSDDVNNYPRCTTYMKHELDPKVFKKNRRSVYNAFVKACGTEKGAIKALTWGNEPSVGVANGMLTVNNRPACGMNPPTFFNQNAGRVIISSVRVVPLEKCIADVDLKNNKRRFECTLLHEIVHFVRMKNSLPAEDWDFPDTEEVGEQFELWAYGKKLCSEDEIFDALASYM